MKPPPSHFMASHTASEHRPSGRAVLYDPFLSPSLLIYCKFHFLPIHIHSYKPLTTTVGVILFLLSPIFITSYLYFKS